MFNQEGMQNLSYSEVNDIFNQKIINMSKCNVDKEVVDEICKLISEGKFIPPQIILRKVDNTYELIDGTHYFLAIIKLTNTENEYKDKNAMFYIISK